MRRLFFALWPTSALRDEIAAKSAPWLAEAGGRAVPPDNLHVTLAFLGAVVEPRVADAAAAARRIPPYDGLQTFDQLRAWGREGPLVLEPTQPAARLLALQAALGNALNAAGFALDSRAFRPHVTLARRSRERLPARPVPAVEWPFAGFVLVESQTAPSGARYSVLERFGTA